MDGYGFDGHRGTETALQNYGLIPVAKGSYIRGTLDVEAELEKIVQSDAHAVVMIGTQVVPPAANPGTNPFPGVREYVLLLKKRLMSKLKL